MKKVVIMAAVAVFGFSNVNAQETTDAKDTTGGFAKGDVYISGSVGFYNTKLGDIKTNSFNVSPSVGYFVTSNIALEAILLFETAKNQDDDKSTNFGGGLGANYFFTPENQFSFTIGAGVAYTNYKFEEDGGDSSKANAFGVSVAPGLNYFVSDCIALRATVGALSYSSFKADEDNAEARNDFRLNLNLSNINFGVTYKF